MLRPIKSLLTYLQKNATEAFNNSPNSDTNNQTVLTEEEQQEDEKSKDMETITPENHFHKVAESDQNENTVKTNFPADTENLLTPSATNVSTPNPEDSFYLDEIPTELIVVDANASSNSILNQSMESVGDPLAIDEFETDELDDPLNSNGNNFVELTNTSSEGIEIEADLPAPSSPSTPLQSILKKRNDKEEQSDGSDSGLGSENSTPSAHNSTTIIAKPLRSNLKRRAEDVDFIQKEKKPKRSINFDVVQVYYFPRRQGFNCVPSQGGCTLGMDKIHSSFKVFPLNDHFYESRPINIQDGTMAASTASTSASKPTNNSSGEESDSDEDFTEASESDMDLDNSGFLQPIPIKQRRVMLKAAGVRKIDPTEKKECKDIRTSREYCGCNCRGFCDPDTCMCSRFGIKCQVDRPSFPCKCTHDTCQNPRGRVEFNPERVRRHYIHTMMRLSLETTSGNTRHNSHTYFLQQPNTDKDHHHNHNGLGPHQYQHHQPSSSTSNNFYVPVTPPHSTASFTHGHDENQVQLAAYNTYYQSSTFNNYNVYDENAHQHQPNYSSLNNGGKHPEVITARCDQLHDESKDIIGFSADGDVELNLNVPTPQPPPDVDEKDSAIVEDAEEESSEDKVYITLEVPKKEEEIVGSQVGEEEQKNGEKVSVEDKVADIEGKKKDCEENPVKQKDNEVKEQDSDDQKKVEEQEDTVTQNKDNSLQKESTEKCEHTIVEGEHGNVEEGHGNIEEGHANIEEGHGNVEEGHGNVEEGHENEKEGHGNVEEGPENVDEDKDSTVAVVDETKSKVAVEAKESTANSEIIDDNGKEDNTTKTSLEKDSESISEKDIVSEALPEKESVATRADSEAPPKEKSEANRVDSEDPPNKKSEASCNDFKDPPETDSKATPGIGSKTQKCEKDESSKIEENHRDNTVDEKASKDSLEGKDAEMKDEESCRNVSAEISSGKQIECSGNIQKEENEVSCRKETDDVLIQAKSDGDEENQKEGEPSSSKVENSEISETPKVNGHSEEETKKIVTTEEMSDPAEDPKDDSLTEDAPHEEEFKDAVDDSKENLKDSSMEIDEDFQDAVEQPSKSTEILQQNGSVDKEPPPDEGQSSSLKENGQQPDLKLIVGQV